MRNGVRLEVRRRSEAGEARGKYWIVLAADKSSLELLEKARINNQFDSRHEVFAKRETGKRIGIIIFISTK